MRVCIIPGLSTTVDQLSQSPIDLASDHVQLHVKCYVTVAHTLNDVSWWAIVLSTVSGWAGGESSNCPKTRLIHTRVMVITFLPLR